MWLPSVVCAIPLCTSFVIFSFFVNKNEAGDCVHTHMTTHTVADNSVALLARFLHPFTLCSHHWYIHCGMNSCLLRVCFDVVRCPFGCSCSLCARWLLLISLLGLACSRLFVFSKKGHHNSCLHFPPRHLPVLYRRIVR